MQTTSAQDHGKAGLGLKKIADCPESNLAEKSKQEPLTEQDIQTMLLVVYNRPPFPPSSAALHLLKFR